jgi:very-short-patch-repair endonuclease
MELHDRKLNQPGRLAKQFVLALSNHIAESRSDLVSNAESLLERIAEAVDVREWDDDPSELVKITGRMLVRLSLMSDIRTTLLRTTSTCESPIEMVFCFALGISAKMRRLAVVYDFGNVFSGDVDGETVLRIQPQVTLGAARVDFLITLQKTVQSEEIKIWRKQVVVECDGAYFHDRLPGQGVRDRKRDRVLVGLGLQVLRFGGSEIWKDSFACASQVLNLLVDCVESQQEAQLAADRKPTKSVVSSAVSRAALA